MTDRSTWKKFEQRIADLFNSVRAPLSGRNGKVTASDSLHPRLFIECKLREHHTVYSLWKATKKISSGEGKSPVLALQEKSHPGALIVCHTDDLDAVVVERMAANPELFYRAQSLVMEKSGALEP